MNNRLLKAALRYAEHGIRVLPCGGEDGKTPLVPHGKDDATTDADTIREWWARWPDANIGGIPGPRYLAVDIDDLEAEQEAIRLGLRAEPAPYVRTGRGEHIWFRHPGGEVGNIRVGRLEVRADAGYVLLPPSVHRRTGRVYQWGDGLKLADAPALPPQFLEALKAAKAHQPAEKLPDIIAEGSRNTSLTSLAGSLRRRGASREAILAALRVENATRCKPPLDDEELERIAGSVAKYPPSEEGSRTPGLQSGKQPSRAVLAVELARSKAQFWHFDFEAFADIKEGAVRETMRVRSRRFRAWLSGLLYEATSLALGGQAAADALEILYAEALKGPVRSISVRVARGEDGATYLDLGNDRWEAVCIRPGGWEVVTEPPVRFVRSRSVRPLPRPVGGGDGWAALKEFVRVEEDEDFITLVGWLVGALDPLGPFPILWLHGEAGSAKTTTGRLLRSLVDPAAAALRTPPRDEKDLIVAACNGWVVAYDNLSSVPVWLSDGLCRVATGAGYGARELYTDLEEVTTEARRPILITSIEQLAVRDDLADRVLPVRLPRIEDNERRDERELWAAFERAHPLILGALLDAAATGLERLDKVTCRDLPRMADWARWVLACEPALPWEPGAFIRACRSVRGRAADVALGADRLAEELIALVEAGGGWAGTTKDLLNALSARLEGSRLPPGWPESVQAMTNRLERVAPLLRAKGWDIQRERTKSGRLVRINRLGAGDVGDVGDVGDEGLHNCSKYATGGNSEAWQPPAWLTTAEAEP